jgi:hypothetical protein
MRLSRSERIGGGRTAFARQQVPEGCHSNSSGAIAEEAAASLDFQKFIERHGAIPLS